MRRMLREKFEYDKIDNFPAYMLDYVVNGERGDLEEREIDAFEDWMDQNGYVSISTVPDEEWSEDFCSHPAFGPACDCVPVYAERCETGDRSGKSRMIKENASYRGATVAKVKRDLSRKLKRAGVKYIREVMGFGSGDQIEMWSKNGEVVDVILRGQSGDPSHIEAILLHTGDKDREYIDAFGNAEAAVDSAVEWLVNKMEKKNESRQRRGRMLNEGPGAGYEIYVRNMEIVDDPEIIINSNGNVKISADVKFYADAYGYDWSTENVAKYVGDDALEGPYTGTIEFEIPNEGDNLNYAKDEFYKGKTFEEMKTWYGGGWFFVPFKGYLDVVLYYDEFWEVEFEEEESANGTLHFSDDAFSKFVSFSHDFEYRCYRLREEVQAYLEKNGLVCDWSDEYLEEFVASWVDDTDEISDSTIEEIVDEMKDRDAVYDPDWNDLEKKNESRQRRGRMLKEDVEFIPEEEISVFEIKRMMKRMKDGGKIIMRVEGGWVWCDTWSDYKTWLKNQR